MRRNYEQRLARIEKKLGEIALQNCHCQETTSLVEDKEEEFETEMNRTCPAHGFRDLGRIFILDWSDTHPKIDELLAKYDLRRSQAHQKRAEDMLAIRKELLRDAG